MPGFTATSINRAPHGACIPERLLKKLRHRRLDGTDRRRWHLAPCNPFAYEKTRCFGKPSRLLYASPCREAIELHVYLPICKFHFLLVLRLTSPVVQKPRQPAGLGTDGNHTPCTCTCTPCARNCPSEALFAGAVVMLFGYASRLPAYLRYSGMCVSMKSV